MTKVILFHPLLVIFYHFVFLFLEKPTPQAESPATELSSSNDSASFTQKDRNLDGENLPTHPYERLRVVSANPVTGIDLTKREVLSKLIQSVLLPSLTFFLLLED